MPIAPVLQTFVNDELTRTSALVERVVAGCLQLLRDGKDAVSVGEAGQRATLVNALNAHAAAYQTEFVNVVGERVQETLLEQAEAGSSDAPVASDSLELLDESRVDVDIEIARAMQMIDSTTEWELRELQRFTSTLIGQKHVSAESNPFRPQIYAAALWQAACKVSPLPVLRTMLLRVSAGVTAGLLKYAWAAACTRLEGMGVEPGIYRTVLLPSGTVAARGPGTADMGPAGSIGNLLASMPSVSPITHDGPGRALSGRPAIGSGGRSSLSSQPEFERAMARLDELLNKLPPFPGKNDLASLLGLGAQRTLLVSLASAPHDRQIIELMARIFDTMLSDPHVPPSFVSTLARLQSSALRVALNDPEMFASIKHATWRLIDRIGEAAYAYPQVNDPRAFALLGACRALVDQLASMSKPDSGLYRRALKQLDDFLDDQRQVQREDAETAVQSLQRAERRDQLDRLLSKRLVDQMVNVRTTPLVRRFVTSVWSQVLAEAMLVHGEQGDVTRSYIKLVDELLWSLQLPDHSRSRQRLLALLPDLLKRLRAGMASISLPAVDQQQLLDDLMAIHTEALRPGTRTDANDLTPEQIVQRMRDEVMPASTGNGGFGDSVIDLSSLETVPAAMLPNEGGVRGDDPIDRVAALVPGQRLRLFLQGRWSRVQLLWRSDQAMFFLFAGENAERTHSVTRRALERLAGAGLMQAFETRPLVQRTLDAVTRGFVRPA